MISGDFINKAKYIIEKGLLYNDKDINDNIELLQIRGQKQEELFQAARNIRNDNWGNKLFIRASLEFSNFCVNKCSYCGMSSNNKKLSRYKVSVDEAKKIIDHITEIGIGQLHIVSGECSNENISDICDIVKYASDNNIQTTTVLGQLSNEDYIKLFDAGARRYILKFETSNQNLYYQYKNDYLYKRIAHLLLLRSIGFKIGTGVIVDLPKSTDTDLANDLNLLELIKPDMASASTFAPNGESELSMFPAGDTDTTLNFISLLRCSLKNSTQMITCSSSLGEEGQYKALMAGANVISYHVTPENYIDNFVLYRAKERAKTKMGLIQKLVQQAEMEICRYE